MWKEHTLHIQSGCESQWALRTTLASSTTAQYRKYYSETYIVPFFDVKRLLVFVRLLAVTSIICIALDLMSNQPALLITTSSKTDQISAQSVRQLLNCSFLLLLSTKSDHFSTLPTVHISHQLCRADRYMREKMLSSLRVSDENICPEVLKPVLCPRCKHVAGHCSSACLVTMIQSPKKRWQGWRSWVVE